MFGDPNSKSFISGWKLLPLLIVLLVLRLIFSVHTEYYNLDTQTHQFIAELMHLGAAAERLPLAQAIPTALLAPLLILNFIYENSVDFLLHVGNIISVVYYCATLVAIYVLARRYLSQFFSFVACLLFALHDTVYAFSGIGEPYIGYAFFLTCLFIVLLHYIEKPSALKAFALGALITICVLSCRDYVTVFAVVLLSLLVTKRSMSLQDRIGFVALPLVIGIVLLFPWFIYLYKTTGVIISQEFMESMIVRPSTVAHPYDVGSIVKQVNEGWFQRAFGWVSYVFQYVIDNIIGWKLWLVFLCAGFAVTFRKSVYWPFYIYIVVGTLSHMFFKYRMEVDQLNASGIRTAAYDIARDQISWIPFEAIIIAASLSYVLNRLCISEHNFKVSFKAAWKRHQAYILVLSMVLVLALFLSVLKVVDFQYNIIARGRYDNLQDPVQDKSTPDIAQVPLLLLAKNLRDYRVVNKRVAVLSRYTTSTNLLSLEAFGGLQEYFSCSAGGWQSTKREQKYVMGGDIISSTMFAHDPPKKRGGGFYSCHNLAELDSLDQMEIDYIILDRMMISPFPRAQDISSHWKLVADSGLIELYERLPSKDVYSLERNGLVASENVELSLYTGGLGINPPASWQDGTIISSGRSMLFVDNANKVSWNFTTGDLLYPSNTLLNLFITYGGRGDYIASIIDSKLMFRQMKIDSPSEVVATAISGPIQITSYANGKVVFRDPIQNVDIHSLDIGDIVIAIDIIGKDMYWFLTRSGKGLIFSPEKGEVVSEHAWPLSPRIDVYFVQKEMVSFCSDGYVTKLAVPMGLVAAKHPFDAVCYDFAGDDDGERLYVSSSAGIFEMTEDGMEIVDENFEVMKITYDSEGKVLAGVSLNGTFKEWDVNGEVLQERELGDYAIAKPSIYGTFWHVITEHGQYFRIRSEVNIKRTGLK